MIVARFRVADCEEMVREVPARPHLNDVIVLDDVMYRVAEVQITAAPAAWTPGVRRPALLVTLAAL